MATVLKLRAASPYRCLVGVGGIGTGLSFALEGNHTLGRGESRPGYLLDIRDYCKLHIICHYVAVLLGARATGSPFHVLPVAKIGNDEAGRRLKEELALVGVDVSHIGTVADRPTLLSVCFQYPNGDAGNITAADSAASTLDRGDIGRCEPALARYGSRSIALAVPEVSLETRQHLLKVAGKYGALRVASFASSEISEAQRKHMFADVDLLALNEDEAATLAGRSLDVNDPEPFLERCAGVLRHSRPAIRTIITAGRRGAFAMAGESWDYCPAPSVTAANTAGAGDALLAGVLSALAMQTPFMNVGARRHGLSLATALDFGVLLAAYSVTSPHTIHPEANLDSVLAFAGRLGIDGAARMRAGTGIG